MDRARPRRQHGRFHLEQPGANPADGGAARGDPAPRRPDLPARGPGHGQDHAGAGHGPRVGLGPGGAQPVVRPGARIQTRRRDSAVSSRCLPPANRAKGRGWRSTPRSTTARWWWSGRNGSGRCSNGTGFKWRCGGSMTHEGTYASKAKARGRKKSSETFGSWLSEAEWILAVDTATETLALALFDGQRVVAETVLAGADAPYGRAGARGRGTAAPDGREAGGDPRGGRGARAGFLHRAADRDGVRGGFRRSAQSSGYTASPPSRSSSGLSRRPRRIWWRSCAPGGGGSPGAPTGPRRGKWKAAGEPRVSTWEELAAEAPKRARVCGEIDRAGKAALAKRRDLKIAPPHRNTRRAGVLAEMTAEHWRDPETRPMMLQPIYLDSIQRKGGRAVAVSTAYPGPRSPCPPVARSGRRRGELPSPGINREKESTSILPHGRGCRTMGKTSILKANG